MPQVNSVQSESREYKPTPSAGYACLSLQTLVVSVLDDQLGDLMTVDDPRAQCAHRVCTVQRCKAQESTTQQYDRNPAVQADHIEQKRNWKKLKNEGLVGVRRTSNGIDQIDGSTEELDASLEKLYAHQSTLHRDIDAENERGEAEDPAL